ncbi:MAG: hypothetical protein ACOY0T_12645 [Myxococcota bacterium]
MASREKVDGCGAGRGEASALGLHGREPRGNIQVDPEGPSARLEQRLKRGFLNVYTEERVTSVECVQCGTRNEVSNEAVTGVDGEAPARVCTQCGAALSAPPPDAPPPDAPPPDAPLNDIFNDFERTFHPAVSLGRHAESSETVESAAPSGTSPRAEASTEALDEAAATEPSAEAAPQTETASPELPAAATAPAEAPSAEPEAEAPAESPGETAAESREEAPVAEPERISATPPPPPPMLMSSDDDDEPEPPPSVARMTAAEEPPAASVWDTNLRASLIDSEWSTPSAAESPLTPPPPPDFAPDASERLPVADAVLAPPEPSEANEPTALAEVAGAASTVDSGSHIVAAASPGDSGSHIAAAASDSGSHALPAPRPPMQTLPWGESPTSSAIPAALSERQDSEQLKESKGPPPPPAWAFAGENSEESSALARALRETAQLRRETGARDVYPAATVVEGPGGASVQIGAVASGAVRTEKSEAVAGEAPPPESHPSFASDASDDVEPPPSVAAIAAGRSVESTQRLGAYAPGALDSGAIRIQEAAPPRIASDAPVVSSVRYSERAPEPFWGHPGSARRSALLGGAAGLAIIGSFFLGRSSVSELPPRSEPVAAKAELPPPTAVEPPAPAPAAVVEKPALESEAPAPPAPAASADTGSPVVVVNTGKNRSVAAAATQNGLPPFDAQAAGRAIADAAARASSCRRLDQPSSRATVTVTFAPSGKVAGANIAGVKFSGATMRNCMGSMFHAARIPAFGGASVTVKKTLKI